MASENGTRPTKLTVERCMKFGLSRERAEREVRIASCEHDYGDRCEASIFGCVRTCTKCGQKVGLNRNCWEHK